jgi:hypothetical protein
MPVTSCNRVVDESVSWLWPGVLPAGKLVILDGDPDLGKSLITLDLCARLSTGRPFPDGQPPAAPANSLVLSAEDKASDTIVPRLKKLGADLGRVAVWQRQDETEPWPWRLPSQCHLLDEALGQFDARLAILDPVMAFLDESVLCASDPSVRRALAPLIHLADKHRCTILLLRHLAKSGGVQPAYRGLGSIAFIAACRYAMLVGRDPTSADRRILAPVRSSLARLPPSLAFRITAAEGEPPTVDWLGTSVHGASDLLVGAVHAGHRERDRAADFLEQFLADGPRTSQETWKACRRAGFSDRTVTRARAVLNIKVRQVHREDRTITWCMLEHQKLPPTGDPNYDSMTDELDELEQRHPSPTPLDPGYVEPTCRDRDDDVDERDDE